MTLADITLPISYEDAQGYALVFTPAMAQRLAELHAHYGSPRCVPMPRTLADGRLMLSADILTEVMPGGLLADMWAAADKAVLLPSVEVIPWADAVALLPQPVPESISPRQARLWLVTHGITPSQVDAVIASIPDAMTRQTVQIDCEYGLEVQRSSPFVQQLGTALGLDADALDDAFREAAAL